MTRCGLPLIEGHTATDDEVAGVEQQLGVTLPAKYKDFMMRYGGGMFGFVDLFPIVSRGRKGDDLKSVNNREFPIGSSSPSRRWAPATTGALQSPTVTAMRRSGFAVTMPGTRSSTQPTSWSSSRATGSACSWPSIRFCRKVVAVQRYGATRVGRGCAFPPSVRGRFNLVSVVSRLRARAVVASTA